MTSTRTGLLFRRQPRRNTSRVWLAAILLVSISLGLKAQEFRGTITGHVADSGGAVVPNASIVAQGPQQTYNAKSGSNGDFTIPLVQPGTYTVTITMEGFKTVERQNIVIDVSSKVDIPVVLEVGAVNETIKVAAQAQQLNTTDASGGTVIDPQQVQTLPLNGRQMYSLLTLTPGVKSPQPGQAASELNESNAYSINGQWGNYNQFDLNGAPVSQQNGGGSGTWNISPSVDAVEEFKVMTNTYDAQYGRTNGGTVNTILKSGTPEFHGTLYDFWRNSILDANTYALDQAGAAKPFHNQHQFGGTLGGPVIGMRKSTFFFFSYEGWREAVPNSVTTTTITPDMLPDNNGNINLTGYLNGTGKTNIFDPLTTTCAVANQNPCQDYTRTQFAGNTIPANRISGPGLSLMKLLPLANRPGYVNNYVVNAPGSNSYNQPIVRVDHDFSDKTRVYGMFAWWAGNEFFNASGFPGPAGTNVGAANGNYSYYQSSLTQVVDLTHTFRPNLFLDVRLSYNRAYDIGYDGAESAGVTNAGASSVGLNMPQLPTTDKKYLPEIQFNGDSSSDVALPNMVGNIVSPTVFETYDVESSMTHVLGPTTLHYGFEVSWYHDVANGVRNANGTFNFGPAFTQQNPRARNNDGSSVADLLLGYPAGGGVEYNDPTYESYKSYGIYIQDDWKAAPRLALNIGLRYENELSPRDRYGRLQAGMCFTCINPINGTVGDVTLPNGESFANPIVGGLEFQKDRSPYQNTWGILLPKFGASFQVTHNLVMRGGWGLFRALGFELGGTSTWDTTTSYVNTLDSDLTPTGYFNAGTPFPDGYTTPPGDSQGLASGNGDAIYEDSWYRKIPYTQQFSFGFQGQAPGGIVWDAEYVGARTLDLRAGTEENHLTRDQFNEGHVNHAYLDQLVNNPFYGNPLIPATSFLGTHPQVAVKDMMVPYPQYDSSGGPTVFQWNTPWGYSNYSSLIASAQKRFSGSTWLSNGLSFTTAFTWSKLLSATSVLNNGLLLDDHPYYGIDSGDRTFIFSFAGSYRLPIGQGGMVATHARGVAGALINHWQLDWLLNNQSGTPVSYPYTYLYNCGNYDIRPSSRGYGSYLNNSQPGCFADLPEYTAYTNGPYSTAVRNPWAEQTQIAMQKEFDVTERVRARFRGEFFNVTNTPIFNGPNTSNPNSPIQRVAGVPTDLAGSYTGFGTIGNATANSPRQIQLSLKVLF